jgi:hypothetical protein
LKGVYNAQYQASGVNTARTLLYLTAPAAKVVEVLSVSVTNVNVTAAEQLDIIFSKITTLGTPTATTIVPRPTETGDQACGSTSKANVTGSEPTYENPPYVDRQGASNAGGYYYDPLPEERPTIAPGDSYGVKLAGTPASTYTLDINVRFREIG